MLNPQEKSTNTSQQPAIPATAYTQEYYLTCCDGHQEFTHSQGQQLPRRLLEPLKLLEAKPGGLILDIGCGRGELIYHLAQQGYQAIGLDYAAFGVEVARQALQNIAGEALQPRLALLQSNAKYLSFPDHSIDCVFMLDVVEHLYPAELAHAFAEISRVLKPGGMLIIHTMPNTWYYAVGYPLYRLVQRLRGVALPPNPKERWAYSDVHVNEQNPIRLFKALKKANFQTKIWLTSIQDYSYEGNKLVRFGMDLLTTVYPFKIVFCNDIFAVAQKPER